MTAVLASLTTTTRLEVLDLYRAVVVDDESDDDYLRRALVKYTTLWDRILALSKLLNEACLPDYLDDAWVQLDAVRDYIREQGVEL
jgi:hypothetical protein